MQTIKERFLAKVKKDGDCWIWTGAIKSYTPARPKMRKYGYGAFRINGKIDRAHRASWIIYHGSIPDGMCVCHKCDVPICVNPEHLFVGTASDNMRDAIKKGRLKRRGDDSPRRILSEAVVKRIRELRRAGRSGKALAKEYGVCQSTIASANTGRNWSHI